MARSRSGSERPRQGALVGVIAAIALLAGCRLFVDLDGIVGESRADGGGADAPNGPNGQGDANGDASVLPDVIEVPPADGGCTSKGGPKPVRITSGSATFCMDSTEVSRAQYDVFLQSAPALSSQIADCAWNGTFVPVTYPYPPAEKDLPVVGVDWCDAYAFCAWSGKRLCGGVGGVAVGLNDFANAAKSEWMMACSKGGSRAYPYGNAYAATACNGTDKATGGLLAVGSQPSCQGGFDGIFDLSGNAHEWTSVCAPAVPDAGPDTVICAQSGSSWEHPKADMACTSSETEPRSAPSTDVGFRCCSP